MAISSVLHCSSAAAKMEVSSHLTALFLSCPSQKKKKKRVCNVVKRLHEIIILIRWLPQSNIVSEHFHYISFCIEWHLACWLIGTLADPFPRSIFGSAEMTVAIVILILYMQTKTHTPTAGLHFFIDYAHQRTSELAPPQVVHKHIKRFSVALQKTKELIDILRVRPPVVVCACDRNLEIHTGN